MNSVIIWYLMVAFTSTNSIAVIPQASREDCLKQANFIMSHRFEADFPSYAYCVYGTK